MPAPSPTRRTIHRRTRGVGRVDRPNFAVPLHVHIAKNKWCVFHRVADQPDLFLAI